MCGRRHTAEYIFSLSLAMNRVWLLPHMHTYTHTHIHTYIPAHAFPTYATMHTIHTTMEHGGVLAHCQFRSPTDPPASCASSRRAAARRRSYITRNAVAAVC